MDWLQILYAGIGGGIGAGVGAAIGKVVQNDTVKKIIPVVLVVLGYQGFVSAYKAGLLPAGDGSKMMQELSEDIAYLPLIKAHDPEGYARLQAVLRDAAVQKWSEDKLKEAFRAELGQVLIKRQAVANLEALRAFDALEQQKFAELREKNQRSAHFYSMVAPFPFYRMF